MGVIICLDLIYNHIHVLITLILFGISIVLQLITGILLSLHYTPHINYSYYSIMYIIREVYYGWFRMDELVTPIHIVPEWYFLSYYAMLKAIPNKNAGFIILLTSILILLSFGKATSIV